MKLFDELIRILFKPKGGEETHGCVSEQKNKASAKR